MKKRHRFFAMLMAILALAGTVLSLLPLSCGAEGRPPLDAGSAALLYHEQSGTVVYKSTSSGFLPAGPAPRLMAALIFAEHYRDDYQRMVTVNGKITGLASSTMSPGLKGGEELSVYDLLCGALIANSDDALFALAFDLYENNADSASLLLEAVNARARTLGMRDTAFVNFTGNDPATEQESANYSSLDDLLLLTLAVREWEVLTEIASIAEYYIPETNKSPRRHLLTRNYMLSAKRLPGYTYSKANGLGASEGKLSGYHAFATARLDQSSYICIVVGAREKYAAFLDAAALIEWGHGAYSYKKLLDTVTVLGEIEVTLSGDSDYVTVVPDRSISVFLPNDADLERDVLVTPTLAFTRLAAPVSEGLIAGEVVVYYKGQVVGTAKLVTSSSLSMSNNRYYLAMASRVIKTPLFLAIAVGVVLLLVVGVLINARVRYLRKKRPEDDGPYSADDPTVRHDPIRESALFDALGESKHKGAKAGDQGRAPQEKEASLKEPSLKEPSLKEEEGAFREDPSPQSARAEKEKKVPSPAQKKAQEREEGTRKEGALNPPPTENKPLDGGSVRENRAPSSPVKRLSGARRLPKDQNGEK